MRKQHFYPEVNQKAMDNGQWTMNNGQLGRLQMGVPMEAMWETGKGQLGQMQVVEFELKYSDVYTQIMQILCCAEFSNNISRYDGIKYGYRAKDYGSLHELYTKSRSEAFGADVKLAAIIGAMVLSQENYTQYYDKAMRLRRLIRDSLDFDKYDVIVSPEHKKPVPLCLCSRLCGLPSVSTPEGAYIADAGCEGVLETVCEGIKGGAL